MKSLAHSFALPCIVAAIPRHGQEDARSRAVSSTCRPSRSSSRKCSRWPRSRRTTSSSTSAAAMAASSVTAAKKYGCKGVGVDIDPARIKDSHRDHGARPMSPRTSSIFARGRAQGEGPGKGDRHHALHAAGVHGKAGAADQDASQTRHAHRRPRLSVPEHGAGPDRRVRGGRQPAEVPVHVDHSREEEISAFRLRRSQAICVHCYAASGKNSLSQSNPNRVSFRHNDVHRIRTQSVQSQ